MLCCCHPRGPLPTHKSLIPPTTPYTIFTLAQPTPYIYLHQLHSLGSGMDPHLPTSRPAAPSCSPTSFPLPQTAQGHVALPAFKRWAVFAGRWQPTKCNGSTWLRKGDSCGSQSHDVEFPVSCQAAFPFRHKVMLFFSFWPSTLASNLIETMDLQSRSQFLSFLLTDLFLFLWTFQISVLSPPFLPIGCL